MAHQGARVNVRDHRDSEFLQVLICYLLRTPVGTDGRELAHRQPFNIRMSGLIVVRVGAVISYLRIGEDDNLSGIRGIGKDFLVTGDGGIKNDFPVTFAFRAMAFTAEDPAIFQRKNSLHCISEGVDFIDFSISAAAAGTFIACGYWSFSWKTCIRARVHSCRTRVYSGHKNVDEPQFSL